MTGPFYSNARRPAPTVEPGRLPSAIGVGVPPDVSAPVGITYEAGRIGGYDWAGDRVLGPVEAVWRPVIEADPVEGRFALRRAAFVDLAKGAG